MSATVQNKFHQSYLYVYQEMSVTVNKCQVSYLGTYPIAGIHKTDRYWNVICMTRSRYDWNNTGSLMAHWPVLSACSKHFESFIFTPCLLHAKATIWQQPTLHSCSWVHANFVKCLSAFVWNISNRETSISTHTCTMQSQWWSGSPQSFALRSARGHYGPIY